MQIPAFALIFRLRHPDKFRVVAEEAWQKALGLINFTRGQQGLPGLIIDRTTHGDTTFTVAYFSAADVADKTALHTRFNFRPALAMRDDFLVLSSTEALARDLLDAVQQEHAGAVQPLSQQHSLAEIDGVRLASMLRVNRDNLVRQNMLEKGHTREQAEAEIDVLLSIAQYFQQVKIGVGGPSTEPRARLQVKLNLP